MRTDGREFELKLDLDKGELAKLAGSPALAGLASGPAIVRQLRSTYFDTAAHDLFRAGITLRVRKSEDGLQQTVKIGRALHAGISNPVEIECAVNEPRPDLSAVPDDKIRKRLKALIGRRKLRPLFRTDITRKLHPLALDGCRAELCLDKGKLSASRKTRPVCEAELELKSGDADAFLRMAQRLFADVPLRFGTSGKAQKGYELLSATMPSAEAQAVPQPVNARQPDIRPHDDIPTAFAASCRSAVSQILPNWRGLLAGDDPEFAHQLRIGLRRLRTALRIFRGAIDTAELRALNGELRRVGQIVGRLRNKDVILADIVTPALKPLAGNDAASRLTALVAGQAALERQAVRTELSDPRWNALLLQLALLGHGAGWPQAKGEGRQAIRQARSGLRKCWRKASRRAADLDALSEEDRHQLRKDLKTLRYAAEFFESLLPPDNYRPFIKSLKQLQEGFGYLNDVRLARTLPQMLEEPLRHDPALAYAAGHVLGWHAAGGDRAWKSIREKWQRLRKQPKLWE